MIHYFIQKMRESKGFTQEYMAQKLGISRPTYVVLEKGQRNLKIEEAKQIAKLFNLSFDQLINEEEPSEQVDIVKSVEKEDTPELRVSIPQKNFEKFREILLYILSQVGGKPNVGETVLYKLLYFIDFDYYEKYEEQLIGATYIKNHFGPTPVEFKKLVEKMIKDGELEIIKSKSFQYDQKKYLAIREPNFAKLLSAQELQHINDVLARLSDKNATELSEYSHQDVPWIAAQEGKPIEYESVFYRTPKTSVRNYGENQL